MGWWKRSIPDLVNLLLAPYLYSRHCPPKRGKTEVLQHRAGQRSRQGGRPLTRLLMLTDVKSLREDRGSRPPSCPPDAERPELIVKAASTGPHKVHRRPCPGCCEDPAIDGRGTLISGEFFSNKGDGTEVVRLMQNNQVPDGPQKLLNKQLSASVGRNQCPGPQYHLPA